MLRVSYSDTPEGQNWKLCGRLAGPWVDDLRAFWRQQRERAPRAVSILDLRDVGFIDEAGERLLAEMLSAGTRLVASGVENQHLIATLMAGGTPSLRRRLEDLCLWEGCPDRAKGEERQK